MTERRGRGDVQEEPRWRKDSFWIVASGEQGTEKILPSLFAVDTEHPVKNAGTSSSAVKMSVYSGSSGVPDANQRYQETIKENINANVT